MMNQTYTTLTCNKLGLKKCQPALLIGIFYIMAVVYLTIFINDLEFKNNHSSEDSATLSRKIIK